MSPQAAGAAGCSEGTAPSPYSTQERCAGAAASARPMSRRKAALSPRARRACASVEGSARQVPGESGARGLRAAAKAGVDEALLVEARQRRRVVVAMLALAPPRRRKAKSEPREV